MVHVTTHIDIAISASPAPASTPSREAMSGVAVFDIVMALQCGCDRINQAGGANASRCWSTSTGSSVGRIHSRDYHAHR